MSQDSLFPEDFGGTARLFPLPNLVLFPHVVQPLHIFEPRYRQLMADALADDRLIAMALLRSDWEEDYHKKPPIHPMVCLGRIHKEEQLSDGRFNLLLQGVWRARIREEVKVDRLYRIARVDVMEDLPVESESLERELRQQMGQAATPFFSAQPAAMEQMRRLLQGGLPLGVLCDMISFALPLEVEVKQQLLEETRVEARVRLLLAGLEDKTPPIATEPPKRPFPPGFSAN